MKLFTFLSAILICCWAFSCEEYPSMCETFDKGLLNLDTEQAALHANFWLADLSPAPVEGDQIGHKANLEIFAKRLRNNCSHVVEIECYGCIETFPVQSHLTIHLDSAGTEVTRTLDILTPADTVMTLRDIHF